MARGRPKQFNDDEVLAKAMAVFWRQGYDATSLDHLIEAMGIPRQSLYRTFKDKRNLFLKALDYYDKNVTSVVVNFLNADAPAIDNIQAVFQFWEAGVSNPEKLGCLMVNTGTHMNPDDKEVASIIKANRRRITVAFEKALKRAQQEGDVPEDVDAKAASRTICATVNGMLGMSRTGLSDAFKTDVMASLPRLIGID